MENDDQLESCGIRNVVSPDFSSSSSSYQPGSPTTFTCLNIANYSTQSLLDTEPSSQSSTGATAGSASGSQQDSSDFDHCPSCHYFESGGLPPLLEHKQQHPAELNRPSHSNSIYTDHGSCNADCKKHMYTAVMHYSQKDRAFADKIQSVLENITLLFHHKEYHARVASLFPLTGYQPLEALHEVQQFEMTTNIIFICTKNYENDEKAKDTGRKIIDAACGTSLRVTQLICDSSTTANTGCASIFYNPESQSFVKDMATILLGKAFREQLIHDESRQRCEAKYSEKVQLRHSESFVNAKGESPKPSFHRTNSFPSSAAYPGKRSNVRTREGQRDARLSLETGETRTNAALVTRKHSVSQSRHETIPKIIENDSLLPPEHMNIGPPDTRQPTDECENVSERAISSGTYYHTIECENKESSISSWVSSTYQETNIEQVNSMSASSSEAHDGPKIKSSMPAKSYFSKNGGTESICLPVAAVSPMPSSFTDEDEDDHQTMQKTSWATEQQQTEVSALHQQQDTGSHQNPASQNQHTVTKGQSSSSQQHSSSQQVRQQTADVQQSLTDQQGGIYPTRGMLREEIAEVPDLQRPTQDLDSQKNMSTSQTSKGTDNSDTNLPNSAAKQREDNGIKQQGRRSLPSRLLHRFTSMVRVRKTSGAKGQKQKPP